MDSGFACEWLVGVYFCGIITVNLYSRTDTDEKWTYNNYRFGINDCRACNIWQRKFRREPKWSFHWYYKLFLMPSDYVAIKTFIKWMQLLYHNLMSWLIWLLKSHEDVLRSFTWWRLPMVLLVVIFLSFFLSFFFLSFLLSFISFFLSKFLLNYYPGIIYEYNYTSNSNSMRW